MTAPDPDTNLNVSADLSAFPPEITKLLEQLAEQAALATEAVRKADALRVILRGYVDLQPELADKLGPLIEANAPKRRRRAKP